MKRIAALLLLVCAHPLLACVSQFIVDPPNPRYGEDVELLMRGSCCNGSPPFGERVRVEGSTITIDYNTPRSGPTVVVPWSARVLLGRLPAGTWQTVVRLSGVECHTQSFTVENREFSVVPPFGQAGTKVVLREVQTTACGFGSIPVDFGGVTVPSEDHGDGSLVVEAPPHAPGPVDISITTECGTTTVRDAFRYGDAHESDFEKVLFPMTFSGRGANGSDWRSENVVRSAAPFEIPADPLRLGAFALARMPEQSDDGGRFLHVPRGMEQWLSFGSHVAGRSRAAATRTEVPVVRLRDTAGAVRLEDVPLGRHSRARLRIYDWDSRPRRVSYAVTVPGHPNPQWQEVHLRAERISCPAAPCLQPEPAFVAVDLPPLDDEEARATIYIGAGPDARIWAFVSVTDDETGHVTLHTPQHGAPPVN